ncbi:hypothetical protein BBX50_11700 [Ensifer sp. LC11]|nr:hypothetical protein BBX50_11700 [Ensifer sp. LC11]
MMLFPSLADQTIGGRAVELFRREQPEAESSGQVRNASEGLPVGGLHPGTPRLSSKSRNVP